MATDITLPDLGEGIESGDVLELLVSEGDVIDVEQGILELETDKATMTVPSTHAGKVTKIHVAEGESVSVGSPLITIEATEGAAAAEPPAEQGDDQAATAEDESQPEEAPAKEPQAEAAESDTADLEADEKAAEEVPAASSKQTTSGPGRAAPQTAQPAARQAEVVKSPVPPPAPSAAPAGGTTVAAGPSVRRFAREVGVDLSAVVGSGPGGRISREDVLNVVRSTGRGPSAQPAGSSSPAPTATATKTAPAKSTPAAAEGERQTDNWGPIRIQRMSKIRRTIAAKMHESWSTVPRVTNFDDADVTDLEEFRQASKGDYVNQGIRLTTMPFVMKAVGLALRHHPEINAAIDMATDQIIYKDYVNIGVAVDTERGLVVPSLRNADTQSIPDIARALAGIADNARTGNFALEDLRGSTFTISNLGAIGGTYSTPIINIPETAILLIGRSRKLPVVIGDEVKIRLMMPLSLSYDHRLIDGAMAARFLNDVIGYLKAPSRLLLAL